MREIVNLKDFVLDRVRGFTIMDYAIYEFTLLSIGALIGAYITGFVKKFKALFGIVFVLGYIYIMARIFFRDNKEDI